MHDHKQFVGTQNSASIYAEDSHLWMAAIVESSEDAIISKDLNGIIISCNQGASRLFGYTMDELIGKPMTTLIPTEHQNEEVEILSRIRRGERIEHFETIRQHKDGTLISGIIYMSQHDQ
jgi:PAS domain S-box-containing protein